ncbi:hypothetical protein Ocin01_02934 [Orchesella cincta]|uniref:Uncharacterized protein n=1 Tax=Orchesella cincta TaxID=48709 RepID=A0A1D2NES2_ORCCI|nr:hypothetical protein Ocin01_02934 [Orchesella cincta]
MRIMEGNQENRTTSGMRQLINLLPEEEIAGLLNTVTSSLVSFGSGVDKDGKKIDARSHAISTILMYTDPISLMNKKRMKKAYLAKYLNQNGIKMTLPPTKNSLSKDILNYWGTDVPDNLTLIDDDESVRARVTTERTANNMLSRSDIQASPNSRVPNGSTVAGNQSSVVASTSNNEVARTDNENAMDFEYTTAITLRQREAHLGQQLGREFSSWFYERLNTLTDFTSAHFWPECNFRLEIVFAADPGRTILEETMSGDSCCAQMKDLIAVKNLYFNPNTLGSGIRGCLNPHGLAQVVVCGVVHQKDNSNPVGVFEQLFGLMKDPSLGNNYRIKFSILRLREGSHLAVQNTPPELCDSSLVGIIEEIDDD